jgi:hypothetical protein
MKPTKKIENIVKVFGMTNQVVSQELTEIEKKYHLELGHLSPPLEEDEYYTQFESAVRLEAAEMGKYYEMFYCLERSIRKLISENMEGEIGSNWWDSGKIPQEIHTEVKKRIQTEVDSGVTRRSFDPLDYTTFGELSQIMVFNWTIFGSMFESQRALQKITSNLNTLRGPIAHCSKLAEDEVLRLKLTIRDWFRITE